MPHQNDKKFFLIEIIPSWSSGKSYDSCKIHSNEFKLYDFDFWKWNVLYPALRVYHFITQKNFEDNLRIILEIVQDKYDETKSKLDYLLERRFE